jgi:hypothetical protein
MIKLRRTIHHHLHIADQTLDNLQGLRNSHLSLLPSKPIQPAQYILDVVIA